MGFLFVIEGVDGSGKATQTKLLYERLLKEQYNVKKVEFPKYESPSSSLVKMYLNGDFGKNAKDVNPYIASTFYAADRYATFKLDFEQFYSKDGIIIADRYTTANMVHQAGKISNIEERETFLDWLWDYEFGIYELPIPNLTFFLDIPVEYQLNLMEGRNNKFTGEEKKDIHESDVSHLTDSYKSAVEVAEKYNWVRINCVVDGELRTIEDINNEIYQKCKTNLN